MAVYQTPIVVPAVYNMLSKTQTINISYDVSLEFPNDPLKSLMAWILGQWQVVGTS